MSDETTELEALYAEAEADGLWVKEWSTGDDGGILAACGEIAKIEALLAKSTLPENERPDVAQFVEMIGLGDVAMAGLGWPGGGDTRVAAVRDAIDKAKQEIELNARPEGRYPGAPEDFFPYGPEEGFEEKGYRFFAFQPKNDRAKRQFILRATKDGEVVREITVPMHYPNQWGVDIADSNDLEAATDKLIAELP